MTVMLSTHPYIVLVCDPTHISFRFQMCLMQSCIRQVRVRTCIQTSDKVLLLCVPVRKVCVQQNGILTIDHDGFSDITGTHAAAAATIRQSLVERTEVIVRMQVLRVIGLMGKCSPLVVVA